MPYIVGGEPDRSKMNYINGQDYDYDYPHGLDLRPDSDFHSTLRDKIWQRARESRNEMSHRFESWNEIDKTLTVFIPLKDKEENLKKEDSTKPISIVFPYTYSVLESLRTYLTMAFFQELMFHY